MPPQEELRYAHGRREHWFKEATTARGQVRRLRSLLADAERVIMAHHVAGRRHKGQVCPQCLVEHETVQAIWRELHQSNEAEERYDRAGAR